MDGSRGIDPVLEASQAELRQFVERIEQLRAEQAYLKEQEKEVFDELKARGYQKRPVRTVIKIRAEDPEKRAEEQAIVEMYLAAVGMP